MVPTAQLRLPLPVLIPVPHSTMRWVLATNSRTSSHEPAQPWPARPCLDGWSTWQSIHLITWSRDERGVWWKRRIGLVWFQKRCVWLPVGPMQASRSGQATLRRWHSTRGPGAGLGDGWVGTPPPPPGGGTVWRGRMVHGVVMAYSGYGV